MTTMSAISQSAFQISHNLFPGEALNASHSAGATGSLAGHEEPGDSICPDRLKWPFPGPHPHLSDVINNMTQLQGWCGNEPRPLPQPQPGGCFPPLPHPGHAPVLADSVDGPGCGTKPHWPAHLPHLF
jgi:hypothetical protein